MIKNIHGYEMLCNLRPDEIDKIYINDAIVNKFIELNIPFAFVCENTWVINTEYGYYFCYYNNSRRKYCFRLAPARPIICLFVLGEFEASYKELNTKPYHDLVNDHGKCYACGHIIKKKQGKYGSFYGCSNYPECKETFYASGVAIHFDPAKKYKT